MENELCVRFEGRVLAVDTAVALKWGDVQARCGLQGRMLPVMDGLIAVTGLVHGLTVVTRNVEGMEASGARILDPWRS